MFHRSTETGEPRHCTSGTARLTCLLGYLTVINVESVVLRMSMLPGLSVSMELGLKLSVELSNHKLFLSHGSVGTNSERRKSRGLGCVLRRQKQAGHRLLFGP